MQHLPDPRVSSELRHLAHTLRRGSCGSRRRDERLWFEQQDRTKIWNHNRSDTPGCSFTFDAAN
jgi:hypothetical protein